MGRISRPTFRTARGKACSPWRRASTGCTASPPRSRSKRRPVAMQVAVVLFTRDLRVHDNPALAAAIEAAEAVLPLFVVDDGIGSTRFGSAPGRRAFLQESLADL